MLELQTELLRKPEYWLKVTNSQIIWNNEDGIWWGVWKKYRWNMRFSKLDYEVRTIPGLYQRSEVNLLFSIYLYIDFVNLEKEPLEVLKYKLEWILKLNLNCGWPVLGRFDKQEDIIKFLPILIIWKKRKERKKGRA